MDGCWDGNHDNFSQSRTGTGKWGYTSFFHRNFTYQTNTEYTAAAAAIKVILQGNLVFIFPLWELTSAIRIYSSTTKIPTLAYELWTNLR